MLWFTPEQLAGKPGMPGTPQNVRKKLTSIQANRRKRSGRKGFEYSIDTLPADTQRALYASNKIENTIASQSTVAPLDNPFTYNPKELWENFELSTNKKKSQASVRLKAINAALDLIDSGVKNTSAWTQAAKVAEIGKSTLLRHYASVKEYEKKDWLAALAPHHHGSSPRADVNDDAWEFFKADYLRNEQPTYAACYHRLQRAALEHEWIIPSVDTIKRKMVREVSIQVRTFAREGTPGLIKLYPAQQRTVRDLHALNWINGDGYQHNVFVLWPNGEIARPKTWFWQDVYSRKILAYRTDQTEHSDLLRLSIGDLLDQYGIPNNATIDNTRAAANKWLTGGVPNRYRFKVKDDDPLGLLPALGIKVHWTSVIDGKGHGQAKPVERSFGVGGLGDYVDKHPYLAGSYTGANVNSKPENYRSNAIPLADFIRVLNEEIIAWNAREGRNTEMAGGTKSFDNVFAESYATSIIQKPQPEQKRLWMLAAEAMTVQRGGTVTLDAGSAVGKGRNRYHSEELFELIGTKIVVRFDPQDLHEYVFIYSLDGRYICDAPCIDATGFGDTEVGREYSRARKHFMRAAKESTKAELKMSAIDVAGKLPTSAQPDDVQAKIVRPFSDPGRMVAAPTPKLSEEEQRTVDDFKKEHARDSATVLDMRNHQERDGRTIYADWMIVKRRINSGEKVPAELIRKLERYKTTSDYTANRDFFEDFGLLIDDYASPTKKPDSQSG